jgi:hypothetical protein
MRTLAVLLMTMALAACGGGNEAEAPEAAAQRGVDRSVADIQAAEAAMQAPVTVSRSVGELTGKASADAGPKAPKAKAVAPAPAAEAPAPAEG